MTASAGKAASSILSCSGLDLHTSFVGGGQSPADADADDAHLMFFCTRVTSVYDSHQTSVSLAAALERPLLIEETDDAAEEADDDVRGKDVILRISFSVCQVNKQHKVDRGVCVFG